MSNPQTKRKHAILSASASHRWMNCTPSARLCERYGDVSSVYADEGTDAHTLCEHKLKTSLGISVDSSTPSLSYYNNEMERFATEYVEYILGISKKSENILVERKLDFSDYVPEGFGTGDCIVLVDETLYVIDFKYGAGVFVSAEDNPQMKLYALGALNLFKGKKNICSVSMTIYQPRLGNVSTYTMPSELLYKWADEVLRPAAKAAFAGEGTRVCGDWCRFCKAKYDCTTKC